MVGFTQVGPALVAVAFVGDDEVVAAAEDRPVFIMIHNTFLWIFLLEYFQTLPSFLFSAQPKQKATIRLILLVAKHLFVRPRT